MRSKLLIGGLLASVMIIPALAQSNPPASAANPAPASTVTTTAPRAQSNLWRTSKLIGLNVYNDKNEKLGDINEILLDKSGKVEGVVIGVGGFLGMGEHDIKVDMAKLKFVERAGPHFGDNDDHHHHHRCGQSSGHDHDHALDREAVVPGPCGAERRQQGTAQEHAAVQVQLSGVTSRKKPRHCRGFFFSIVSRDQDAIGGTGVARRIGPVQARASAEPFKRSART